MIRGPIAIVPGSGTLVASAFDMGGALDPMAMDILEATMQFNGSGVAECRVPFINGGLAAYAVQYDGVAPPVQAWDLVLLPTWGNIGVTDSVTIVSGIAASVAMTLAPVTSHIKERFCGPMNVRFNTPTSGSSNSGKIATVVLLIAKYFIVRSVST